MALPQASGLLPEPVDSASEIISWLFSDTMLDNVRDPLLSPTYYTFDSPMALQNLLTPPASSEELGISEVKRKHMLDLMPGLRADLAAHNIAEDVPFQSRYLTAYWSTFHPQFPILHKPTFNPDKYPSGLLWCLLLEGAALLQDDLIARLIADPLRWTIFGSPDFNPPAKLWVIQALLILEVYEKTQGDRQMHVRSHLHHGTTLQLLRRGTILTGGSSENMFHKTKRDGDDYLTADASDPWKRWIQNEAAKRAALMAFVVDTYHSIIFGHPSMIAIHEIRVSLPCSPYLWDTFPEEGHAKIPRMSTLPLIEALKVTLNNKHVDTSPFGRKVLLSGLWSIARQMELRDIQLESVDWYNSTHNGNERGSGSNWKSHICASIDFWQKDFGNSLRQSNSTAFDRYPPPASQTLPPFIASTKAPSETGDLVSRYTSKTAIPGYETRVPSLANIVVSGCVDPFYHLAHMFLYVTHLDLHIFAGAPEMYSRYFRPADFERSYQALKTWALSPLSWNALRHAAMFLEEIYCPSSTTEQCPNPYTSRPAAPGEYKAANDTILHRPRAIFCATLVIWSYGYVCHGPESQALLFENSGSSSSISSGGGGGGGSESSNGVGGGPGTGPQKPSVAAQAAAAYERALRVAPKKDGFEYLRWLASNLSSLTPRNKMKILEGSNETAGLIRLVVDSLQGSHWPLIEEDRRLIIHCLERTLGKPSNKCSYYLDVPYRV